MKTTNERSDETDIARRRKAQVLDAAAECFRERGFHRSSLAQIAAAAGMSPGHIYHYFKSKEEIVAAIVERERSDVKLLVDEAKATGADADIAFFVDQLARGVAWHNDTSRASLTMEILAEAARNPEIARVVQRNDADVRELLFALFQDRSPHIQSRLEIVGALMAGLSVRALRNPQLSEDLDLDMLRSVVRHLLTT